MLPSSWRCFLSKSVLPSVRSIFDARLGVVVKSCERCVWRIRCVLELLGVLSCLAVVSRS